jgi:GH24 family phage-related lysozyme (muramidase)
MKTNPIGLNYIEMYKTEYGLNESRTTAEKFLSANLKRRINSNQFSALVCLIVAIGIDDFLDGKILNLINSGNVMDAADKFDICIYTDDEYGRRIADPFLIRQRELEKALFLTPELVQKSAGV